MKNIFILLLLCSTLIQAQDIDIEGWDGEYITGAYYKDINNHLNQFEGTYKYTEGNTELTMVFKKIVKNEKHTYTIITMFYFNSSTRY